MFLALLLMIGGYFCVANYRYGSHLSYSIDRRIFAPPTSSGEPRDKLAEVSGRRLGELSSQKKVSFLTLLGPPGHERCILAPQTSRGQAKQVVREGTERRARTCLPRARLRARGGRRCVHVLPTVGKRLPPKKSMLLCPYLVR